MQEDFHYYATYCAAFLAGYSHEESSQISYAAQFVDCCTKTLIKKLDGPLSAATTQSQMELMDAITDIVGLQNITRIWSSFHFLPFDLEAKLKKRPKLYMQKYRLICKPNGALVSDTVKLAKNKSLAAIGLAMHVLADTWAHSYFAGTPSQVINNTNAYFYELRMEDDVEVEQQIKFRHNPTAPDDVENGIYTNSIHQENENSIMNLGHGRAGHFPDYSFARYRYMPAWGDYEMITKDNQSDYYKAFCQMVYAMKYLRGEYDDFALGTFDKEAVEPHEVYIKSIIKKRQINACDDWKAFGEKLSGETIEDFDIEKYQKEYLDADKADKNNTFLGQFFKAAMAQKSMVTNQIFKSGNRLAGFSIDYKFAGFKGIKDFQLLLERGENYE